MKKHLIIGLSALQSVWAFGLLLSVTLYDGVGFTSLPGLWGIETLALAGGLALIQAVYGLSDVVGDTPVNERFVMRFGLLSGLTAFMLVSSVILSLGALSTLGELVLLTPVSLLLALGNTVLLFTLSRVTPGELLPAITQGLNEEDV